MQLESSFQSAIPTEQTAARMSPTIMARAQGAFYIATGIWPLIHLKSFEAITGPKPEGWLVKTVGCLISVIGGGIFAAARGKRITPEIRAIAMGSAASLALVDVIYVAKRRISPVYLLDAMAELGLISGWVLAERRG